VPHGWEVLVSLGLLIPAASLARLRAPGLAEPPEDKLKGKRVLKLKRTGKEG
jgi:hypothetical protein